MIDKLIHENPETAKNLIPKGKNVKKQNLMLTQDWQKPLRNRILHL